MNGPVPVGSAASKTAAWLEDEFEPDEKRGRADMAIRNASLPREKETEGDEGAG